MSTEPGTGNPERRLAIGYARAADRPGLAALFALDDMLAGILRTTREPLVGQMRLTWWHDALSALDHAAAPAEPLLQALAENVLARGISGARLSGLVEGWEALLDAEVLENEALSGFARRRGGQLFDVAGLVLNAALGDPIEPAGDGWALADLARHVADVAVAQRAVDLARKPLDAATGMRWSRNARPLGALALIAEMDVNVPLDRSIPTGSPARIARLLRHRLTGR